MNRRELFAAGAVLGLDRLSRRWGYQADGADRGDDADMEATIGAARNDRPRPTAAQLAWHRNELALFVHFTVNTFTGREWGDGTESPSLFDPKRLDARQWVRAAKAGGFGRVIITAKHHDGFCLWPTETTEHSVKGSGWRSGKGDVVRELVDACSAEGFAVGVYLSPWDRHERVYGDSPRYNDFYIRQLTELLTRYGPLVEVWFDGANGEGPNGRRQEYDWPRIHRTVRELQPNAVMFSDAGPDIRWIGNERGIAGDPNWCTVDPSVVPYPGISGPSVAHALQQGDPFGSVWRPGEADVSIRPGWFWHAQEDEKVRSVQNLVDLYFSSVGRNAGLLLNVPPTADGLFHETDVARLGQFGDRIRTLFATSLAAGAAARANSIADRRRGAARVVDGDVESYWMPAREVGAGAPAWVEIEMARPTVVDIIGLEEAIRFGQTVAYYRVQGRTAAGWTTLTWGTTIGYRKLDRIAPVEVDRCRLEIMGAFGVPRIATFALYRGGG